MIVRNLRIQNLRNHIDSQFEFEKFINVIHGKNGIGKTTILESISLVSMTKSFLPNSDSSLIRSGEKFYQINCNAENDIGVDYKINIRFNGSGKKIINSNLGDNLLPKNIIGELPIVVLSPDFKNITFGSPVDRRFFIDSVLSQASRIYVEEAIKLKKFLKQRNILLNDFAKGNRIDFKLFDTLTELFINTSAEIVSRRSRFINEFKPYFEKAYRIVASTIESAEIFFKPDSIQSNIFSYNLEKNDIIESYQSKFEQIRDKEFKRGLTLFGPQKDDLEISVNGNLSKDAASQGQHKTLLISLKFAEFEFLKNARNETPVFLLDDIYSELDEERSENVTHLINELKCQSLITTTELNRFKSINGTNNLINYIKLGD